MSSAFDAVWFDFDGTLVDSRDGVGWALTEAVREVLPEAVLPPITPQIGPPIPEMLRTLLPDDTDAHPAIFAAFRRLYDEEGGWQRTEVFPGIAEALEALRTAGVRMDVVTNKRALPTRRMLEHFGLAQYITEAVSLDSAEPAHESKAQAMSWLLETSGLAADRVAYVGDTPGDRNAAQLLGCPFVWVEWGFGGAGAPPGRDDFATINRAQQLPLVLLSPRH
ncbi:HAD hydrolase-like protein [Svornostia abyssi]|uniref:HAD hydrolase-like protein n=1 Tax=Svornostia abyssi TaxID=2898438 RepID=A0ABY5PHJ4_9ACTN|nr:HAD hydrolase-like protein [Parviterribacteraceae bacterium J379]